MINITLPDGTVRQYESGVSAMEVAQSISEGLARNVLSAKVDNEIWDANRPIEKDAKVQLLTWRDQDGKKTFWHSSAHLMAEALEAIYPGIKLGTGPATDNGFYYDVDPGEHKISADDFPKIEQKILELAREKNSFVRKLLQKEMLLTIFLRKEMNTKLS